MKSKSCTFKKPDGSYNIVEGPDEQGRVRIQCLDCGRLYPSKNRDPRAIDPRGNVKGIGCNPARRAQRLLARRASASEAKGASCPENCINRAAAAQAKMIAELSAALLKAKNHELQAVVKRMLEHAQRNEIDRRFFQQARELAIKQALADGRDDGSKQLQVVAQSPPTGGS